MKLSALLQMWELWMLSLVDTCWMGFACFSKAHLQIMQSNPANHVTLIVLFFSTLSPVQSPLLCKSITSLTRKTITLWQSCLLCKCASYQNVLYWLHDSKDKFSIDTAHLIILSVLNKLILPQTYRQLFMMWFYLCQSFIKSLGWFFLLFNSFFFPSR